MNRMQRGLSANGSVRLTLLGLGLIAGGSAQAQWSFDPVLRAGAESDDNATLTVRTDEEINLEGILLEAIAGLAYEAPRTNFSLQPRVRSNNYSDNPEAESTDVFVASRWTHQTQSSAFGLRVNFDQQTARTAERADTDFDEDIDDITGDDSGRVGTFGKRDKWRFRPSFAYGISDVSTLSAELDYIDVQYDDVFAGILEDYQDLRMNLEYRQDVSDRTTTIVELTGRQYESAATAVDDITGYGARVGVERALSETTRLTALVGVEDTDIGSAEPVGEIALRRRLETINIVAQYRRSINASGVGRVSLRDQINVNFTRQLNERLAAGIGARVYRVERLEDDTFMGGDAGRDYVQLRSNIVWNFTPQLAFEADYRYTILDRSNTFGESSNSNRIAFWLVYRPNAVN